MVNDGNVPHVVAQNAPLQKPVPEQIAPPMMIQTPEPVKTMPQELPPDYRQELTKENLCHQLRVLRTSKGEYLKHRPPCPPEVQALLKDMTDDLFGRRENAEDDLYALLLKRDQYFRFVLSASDESLHYEVKWRTGRIVDKYIQSILRGRAVPSLTQLPGDICYREDIAKDYYDLCVQENERAIANGGLGLDSNGLTQRATIACMKDIARCGGPLRELLRHMMRK